MKLLHIIQNYVILSPEGQPSSTYHDADDGSIMIVPEDGSEVQIEFDDTVDAVTSGIGQFTVIDRDDDQFSFVAYRRVDWNTEN